MFRNNDDLALVNGKFYRLVTHFRTDNESASQPCAACFILVRTTCSARNMLLGKPRAVIAD